MFEINRMIEEGKHEHAFGALDLFPTRKLPNGHIVLPIATITEDLVAVPESEAYRSNENLLIQTTLQTTQMFSHDGTELVPLFYKKKQAVDGASWSRTSPGQPLVNSDNSATSVIYQAEAPIFALTSKFLQTGFQSEGKIEASIDWIEVMRSIFNEFDFIDARGNMLTFDQIKRVTDPFGNDLNVNFKELKNSGDYMSELQAYLGQFFTFDFSTNSASLKDTNPIKTRVGKAMRAITPFCYGNCPTGCRFCYVTQDGIRYPSDWQQDFDKIQFILDQYDPKTGLGLPPATRALMDWEPTNHPDFYRIIDAVHKRELDKQISIVTHGGHLTEELLDQIAQNQSLREKILFQVSLNSSDPNVREGVMPGVRKMSRNFGYDVNETAIKSLELMRDRKINFDVSIVAAEPWIPLDDVLKTIKEVDRIGGIHSYIRVALPTGTGKHRDEIKLSEDRLKEIDDAVCNLRDEVDTPIVVTVGLLNPRRQTLDIILEGTMPDSAARKAGINHHHKIMSINGQVPRSRTDASLQLINLWDQYKRDPENTSNQVLVEFSDENGERRIIDLLEFERGSNKDPRIPGGDKPVGVFGLLISDDIDFNIFSQMAKIQKEMGYNNPIMITSKAMEPIFNLANQKLLPEEMVSNLEMFVASNDWFNTPPIAKNGEPVKEKVVQGNVNIAGLLTLRDVASRIDERLKQEPKPDCIYLPASMFSDKGYDMTGRHYNDLAHYYGIPVVPINSRTGNI